MALDLGTKNGFRAISFEYIGELDSYFIHRYIIIKDRSSSITSKIHRLLSELWPLISVRKMVSRRYLLNTLVNWIHISYQGWKIALVRSYLRVPQAAGQVKILMFLLKIKFFPIYANIFSDAGQVPILRYFEACIHRYIIIKYRSSSITDKIHQLLSELWPLISV